MCPNSKGKNPQQLHVFETCPNPKGKNPQQLHVFETCPNPKGKKRYAIKPLNLQGI